MNRLTADDITPVIGPPTSEPHSHPLKEHAMGASRSGARLKKKRKTTAKHARIAEQKKQTAQAKGK